VVIVPFNASLKQTLKNIRKVKINIIINNIKNFQGKLLLTKEEYYLLKELEHDLIEEIEHLEYEELKETQ
jgi:hypothetical protein